MEKFGSTIKSLRVACDFSLKEFAQLVGITNLYLDRVEQNSVIAPKEIAITIVEKLTADQEIRQELLNLWNRKET